MYLKLEPKSEQAYNLIRTWIGDGLLTSHGNKWARNRKLLTPAFHFEILKNYIEIKNRCADVLLVSNTEATCLILLCLTMSNTAAC